LLEKFVGLGGQILPFSIRCKTSTLARMQKAGYVVGARFQGNKTLTAATLSAAGSSLKT